MLGEVSNVKRASVASLQFLDAISSNFDMNAKASASFVLEPVLFFGSNPAFVPLTFSENVKTNHNKANRMFDKHTNY